MPLALRQASADFFEPLGGTVGELVVEPLEPESGTAALGATVTVTFDNAGIFGDERADIYDDVYPRYRALREQWWRALADRPVDHGASIRPYLHPLPAAWAPVGPPLPARPRPARDVRVVPLDSMPRSSYMDRLRREYGLTFGLQGPSGRLFDLAEGLLVAARAATETADVDSVVELGAGTGAVTSLVLRRARPARALVQDDSAHAVRHLREHVGPQAIAMGSRLDIVDGDCRQLDFGTPISLLVLGIPFAAQPSLLAARGRRIRDALGEDGLLVAATSSVGMRFYQALIDGDDPRLAGWPWHVPGVSLRDLFPTGATLRVRNLVISIASASTRRVDATVAAMAARGAEVLA